MFFNLFIFTIFVCIIILFFSQFYFIPFFIFQSHFYLFFIFIYFCLFFTESEAGKGCLKSPKNMKIWMGELQSKMEVLQVKVRKMQSLSPPPIIPLLLNNKKNELNNSYNQDTNYNYDDNCSIKDENKTKIKNKIENDFKTPSPPGRKFDFGNNKLINVVKHHKGSLQHFFWLYYFIFLTICNIKSKISKLLRF